ncbi:MAG: HD domain-containing protein, partial [Candidatus Omnitrophica bacterium]|nr:HD domain-containing protein [Candidatus Omnitrophota bacterium]
MSKKNSSINFGPVVDFILEAGLLKRVERSGWSVVGMKQKESVAEHSFRCAIIGYLLASLEGADSSRVILMTLFGDMHEARITDLHKMAQRYIDVREAESAAFSGQISRLPEPMACELARMRREYTAQETKESIIARDADILECLIQAKEYYEFGF